MAIAKIMARDDGRLKASSAASGLTVPSLASAGRWNFPHPDATVTNWARGQRCSGTRRWGRGFVAPGTASFPASASVVRGWKRCD